MTTARVDEGKPRPKKVRGRYTKLAPSGVAGYQPYPGYPKRVCCNQVGCGRRFRSPHPAVRVCPRCRQSFENRRAEPPEPVVRVGDGRVYHPHERA